MTTDDKTLTEQTESALWGLIEVYDARSGRGTEVFVHAPVHAVVAAVLPIIRKVKRDAARAALDGLIADTAIDVRLGTEGNDPQRVQDAEAVIDAAQVYRDIEYPEEAP